MSVMNHVRSSHFVEKVRRLFGGAPCRLQVAALPWRKTEGGVEVMLITSRDTGRWVLPKGWPEFGEQFCRCRGARSRRGSGPQGRGLAARSRPLLLCQVLAGGDSVAARFWSIRSRSTTSPTSGRKSASASANGSPPQQAAEIVAEGDLGKLILEFAADPRRVAA